jgi:hypothetical protein
MAAAERFEDLLVWQKGHHADTKPERESVDEVARMLYSYIGSLNSLR